MSDSGRSNQIRNLDLFNEALGNNVKFELVWDGFPLSFTDYFGRPYKIHLRDNAHRTLLIVTFTPGRNHLNHGTEDTLEIANTSGETLLTAKGVPMRLWSGDQLLGRVDFTFQAFDEMNRRLFQIQTFSEHCCVPTDCMCCIYLESRFSIVSNGVILAHIKRSNDESTSNGEIHFLNRSNCEAKTEALIVLVATLVYIAEYAETTYGRTGTRGMHTRTSNSMCAVFLVLLLLLGLLIFFLIKKWSR